MANRITTSLLDSFNRADEDPLYGSGNWGQVDPVDYPDQLQLKAHRAKGFPTLGSGVWTSRWLPLTLNDDIQAWSVAYQPPTVGWYGSLRLLGNTGLGTSTLYGYIANFRNLGSGNSTSILYRMDNSVATQIDSQATGSLWSTTSYLLLETLGTHVRTSWSDDPENSWTTLNDVVDNTYRTGLKLVLAVIETQLADAEWFTFGGGNPPTGTTRNQLPYLGVGP